MITDIAQQLFELKNEVKEIEDKQKAELAPKKEQLDKLQSALIEELTKNNLKSIKTETANFSMATRTGFNFVNEIEARKWAKENDAFSIDKRIAAQILAKQEELPEFVKKTETNYLTIKAVK